MMEIASFKHTFKSSPFEKYTLESWDKMQAVGSR